MAASATPTSPVLLVLLEVLSYHKISELLVRRRRGVNKVIDLPCISIMCACYSKVSALILADYRDDLKSAKWIRSSNV